MQFAEDGNSDRPSTRGDSRQMMPWTPDHVLAWGPRVLTFYHPNVGIRSRFERQKRLPADTVYVRTFAGEFDSVVAM
jgi:hypothetical protein